MARALSPLVALYLLTQLSLLPFVVAEREAPPPEPPRLAQADSLPFEAPAPDSVPWR